MDKKIVLSGIKPSGDLTLGNYLGAIKNWIKMQDEYSCYFSIVNLHAITVNQEPEKLLNATYEVLATYLAAGLDIEKSTVFVQSQVSAHSELSWLLTCNSYMGELSRMTQFKDKTSKINSEDSIGVGLFSYPILMAADILLYNADAIPVGADQKQHVELTRDIANRFNNAYGETFVIPEPIIGKTGARIMDLQDPTRKMSKSDQDGDRSKSANGYILLSDSDDTIMKKVKKAVTDDVGIVQYNEEQKGIKNLFDIYCTIKGVTPQEAEQTFKDYRYGDFKKAIAETIIEEIGPIRDKRNELLANRTYLNEVCKIGANRANQRASKTLIDVKNKMGII